MDHGLNWLLNHPLWQIGHCVRHGGYYVIVCLRCLRTQPHLATSRSRPRLWHLELSGDDINNLHKLPQCCRWWCGCCHVCLELHNCRNLRFSHTVLQISLTEVVGYVPTSKLRHFAKPHLLLPKALHAVLYRFRECAHHPARFIIFTQLAKLCIFFIIIFVFPILLIFGTSKIAQTVYYTTQHLLKCCFRLCGCQSCLFNIPHRFLFLRNRRLCIVKSLSCPCALSIHMILDPFLFFFIAWEVRSPLCLRWKLLLGS